MRRPSYLLLCLTMACVTSATHSGPPERPSGGYLRTSTIVSRYAQLWGTMSPVVDSHRVLLQPAFSTPDRARVWLALPRNMRRWSPERVSRQVVRWTLRLNGTRVPWADVEIEVSEHNTARLTFAGAPGATAEVSLETDHETLEATLHFFPETDGDFSFLAYSCSGPFGMDRPRTYPDGSSRGTGENGIFATHVNSFNLMRERVSGGITVLRPDGEVAPAPSFGIAMGDQIYVDADAGLDISESLSLFHGARSQVASVDLRNRRMTRELLTDIYRYHWAIPPLAEAMARIPVAMVWDDHELRDGWGSQGDEDDPIWQQYFQDARSVYGAFQQSRNPETPEGELVEFDWGPRVHVLMLDQRMHKTMDRMLRPQDYAQLREWFAQHTTETPSLYVLVSPIPLSSWSLGDILAGATGSGVADDMRDRVDEHETDMQQLFDAVADHFGAQRQDRLLVLSGDLHRSAVTLLRMCSGQGPCDGDAPAGEGIVDFGWEVISSGIANDRHVNGALTQALVNTAENTGIDGRYGRQEFQLVARPRGGISNSPSFAEVHVQMVDGRPQPSVVFFPSGWSTGLASAVLANDYRALRSAPIATVDVWRGRSGVSDGVRDSTLGWVTLPWTSEQHHHDGDAEHCLQYDSTFCVTGIAAENTTSRWAGWGASASTEPIVDEVCGPALPSCESLIPE